MATIPLASSTTFGCVLTTIGRVHDIERLLSTIPEPVEVAIAWQCSDPIPETIVERSNTRVVKSDGGASRGRNDAYRALRSSPDYLLFPNDDTYYPEDFFGKLAKEIPRGAAVSLFAVKGTTTSRQGLRRWDASRNTADNVLRASHEAGLVVSRELFLQQGGFLETISVGSDGYQSGEGSDFVARTIRTSGTAPINIVSVTALEGDQEDGALRLRKRERYLPGTVYVAARHDWMDGSKRAILRQFLWWLVRSRRPSVLKEAVKAYDDGKRDSRWPSSHRP